MPRARKTQISLEATPYYHCISRCVRRAFLCGEDRFTGRNFDHRKKLLESELLRLSGLFFLDISAYAIMSNHYHVVLFINKAEHDSASAKEVVARWHQIHKGNDLSHRYQNNETLSPVELESMNALIELWRQQLLSISWFMRVINEKMARVANKEDEVTGRFWEGRFTCQALLDEPSILTCMVYVDLNPIRAGIAKTPETSPHTSIKKRIECLTKDNNSNPPEVLLHPFVGNYRQDMPEGIAFHFEDYLQLVDWTGRAMLDNKRGSIADSHPPILNRLSITTSHWLYLTSHFESHFKGLVGTLDSLKRCCGLLKRTRVANRRASIILSG